VAGLFLLVFAAYIYVTQPLLGVDRSATSASPDPSRLAEHVSVISGLLTPRDESHPDNLDRVAAYVRQEFEAAGARVSEQPYQADGKTYRNVVAAFGRASEERIVVGAHYDTYGPLPGADDNASGVAGLIELAYLVGAADLPLQVDLVAFTLEEPPFFRTAYMGSAVHAEALKQEGVRLRVMMSLEMIGYFTDAEHSQSYPGRVLGLFYPSKGNFISIVGKFGQVGILRRVKRAMSEASELPVYSMTGPRFVPGIDFSDHLNYWNHGYPAVMITDTAFHRNLRYHTKDDTADHLDYVRMADVVAGVYAAVRDLAR
jgi:Zn-dependent M28 family amino/carboxypeptidase